MNPFENFDILKLVVGFLNRKSCFRLLRVNRQIRDWLGKSNIWQKFFNPKFKFNIKFTYHELCQKLEGNKLAPNTIRIRDYYGESYYRLIFQIFNFHGYISFWDLINADKSDVGKIKYLFQDFHFRNPFGFNSLYRKRMFQLLASQTRETFKLRLAGIDSKILKKISIYACLGPNFKALHITGKRLKAYIYNINFRFQNGQTVIHFIGDDDNNLQRYGLDLDFSDKMNPHQHKFYQTLIPLCDSKNNHHELGKILISIAKLSLEFRPKVQV